VVMVREKRKQETTCKAYSIDAPHRGGLTRSIAETPVMGVEKRGQVTQLLAISQPHCGRST